MTKETAHEIAPYHVWATSRKEAIERLREYLHVKLADKLANKRRKSKPKRHAYFPFSSNWRAFT